MKILKAQVIGDYVLKVTVDSAIDGGSPVVHYLVSGGAGIALVDPQVARALLDVHESRW